MRTYLIEDIEDDDLKKVMAAFEELGLRGPLDGIYYLPMPEKLLQQEQKDHLDDCGPYFMALEFVDGISENLIKLELLVRARHKIRCTCVTYATADQRNHMVEYLDQFIDELEVSV